MRRKLGRIRAAGALLLLAGAIRAADVVNDAPSRLAVLKLAFPNARISEMPRQVKSKPFAVLDPLGRRVAVLDGSLPWRYEVVGPVAREEEGPATNLSFPEPAPSDKRNVSMQLYRAKDAADGESLLVAVLEYSVPLANPARCCRAKGRILILPSAANRVYDNFARAPNAFTGFKVVRFIDTSGGGVEQLMVGADTSGEGSSRVSTAIFALANRRLTPLLLVNTVVLDESNLNGLDIHSLSLDERETKKANGQRFVFKQRTFAEKSGPLPAPRTNTVSYAVGSGLPLDWR